MRRFERALILLSEYHESGERYLVHRARHGWWELPWRDRGEQTTYREAVAGELESRFALDTKKDFIVCSTPRISLIVHPASMKLISREDVDEAGFGVLEIYPVQLFGSSSRDKLAERSDLQWWTAEQFADQQLTPQTLSAVDGMDLVGSAQG